MANSYIFDVDGTLTPSRGTMDPDFKQWFNHFASTHIVYLITGSDRAKTVEQIGEDTYGLCSYVYNCNGNDLWQGEKNLWTNAWGISPEIEKWLQEKLVLSEFSCKTGRHIENRPGMCNFSIVGRNANQEQREMYVRWDESLKERESIAREFNQTFPGVVAKVGGETGLDIAPAGADKSQILRSIPGPVKFYGDRTDPAGNDYPLAQLIVDYGRGACYTVKNWQETWELLKNEL
jgi:phosphomannomutase